MRAFLLGLALLSIGAAGAAAEPADLMITVQVTGAIDHTETYRHPADADHGCRPAVEVPPAPGPGSHFDNLPYRVEFAPSARPPESSFQLRIPYVAAGPERQPAISFQVSMTAGGHVWQGETPALAGSAETEDGGARGHFRIAGLRATDTDGAITVEGSWTCP